MSQSLDADDLALAVLRNAPNLLALAYDPDMRILRLDGRGLAPIRLDPTSLVGRRVSDVVPAAVHQRLLPICEAALAGHEQSCTLLDRSATYRADVFPIRDPNGAVAAGGVIARDVTGEGRRASTDPRVDLSLRDRTGPSLSLRRWLPFRANRGSSLLAYGLTFVFDQVDRTVPMMDRVGRLLLTMRSQLARALQQVVPLPSRIIDSREDSLPPAHGRSRP